MSIKTIAASAAIAAGAIAVAAPGSAQAADLSTGQQVLRVLCTARGGDFYVTPFNLARCQSTPSRTGRFPVEQFVCAAALDGDFTVVPTFGAGPNRYTWACIPT